jgi:membrane-associated phospholipid phosphatase
MTPPALSQSRARAARGGVVVRGGGRREVALFAATYAVYLLARWLAAGDMAPAVEHAQWVIDLERGLGVGVERSVQDHLDTPVVTGLLSNIYLAAQLVVLPGSLLWLFRRSRAVYGRLRDTVIATWLIAVPIFALFPVAPPRLAGIGMSDTVSRQAGVALTGHSTIFYNPIAAVPSLHCGFAMAVGIALAAAARRPWTRAVALLWGPLVCLSVVATGNHYVFDIAAGLLVTVLGCLARPAFERLLAALRRPVLLLRPLPAPA